MQVSSKVVSLAWTNDGQFLALGLYDGQISIRSRVGEETVTIQRNAPVWTLSWSPDKYIPSQVYKLFSRSLVSLFYWGDLKSCHSAYVHLPLA